MRFVKVFCDQLQGTLGEPRQDPPIGLSSGDLIVPRAGDAVCIGSPEPTIVGLHDVQEPHRIESLFAPQRAMRRKSAFTPAVRRDIEPSIAILVEPPDQHKGVPDGDRSMRRFDLRHAHAPVRRVMLKGLNEWIQFKLFYRAQGLRPGLELPIARANAQEDVIDQSLPFGNYGLMSQRRGKEGDTNETWIDRRREHDLDLKVACEAGAREGLIESVFDLSEATDGERQTK